jgi:hypothetical protein
MNFIAGVLNIQSDQGFWAFTALVAEVMVSLVLTPCRTKVHANVLEKCSAFIFRVSELGSGRQ